MFQWRYPLISWVILMHAHTYSEHVMQLQWAAFVVFGLLSSAKHAISDPVICHAGMHKD